MSNNTGLFRIASLDGDSVSWSFDEHFGESEFSVDGKLGAVHEALTNRAEVLLSGTEVLVTRAEIPSQRRWQLFAAVPYSVENELASDVEDCCYAISRDRVDGGYAVACVDQLKFKALLDRLTTAGIRPSKVIPDILAVPFTAQQWSILITSGLVLMRTGLQAGFAIEMNSFPAFFHAVLLEAEQTRPNGVNIYVGAAADAQAVAAMVHNAGISSEVRVHPQGQVFWWFETEGTTTGGIDFLEGRPEFSRLIVNWRPFRLVGALLTFWLALVFGTKYLDYRVLRKENARLTIRIEDSYRGAFPDVRSLVKPRQQMARRLGELRGGSGERSVFLPLLTSVSQAVEGIGDMQIMSVTYNLGKLNLDVQVAALSNLDVLKEQLRNNAVAAEVLSATTKGSVLRGRLRIELVSE